MERLHEEFPFRCVLSLKPLIDLWLDTSSPAAAANACLVGGLMERLPSAPELQGPIEDLAILDRHKDLVQGLMSAVFPTAFWDTEPLAAVVPFCMTPVVVSPLYRHLFLKDDGSLKGQTTMDEALFYRGRLTRAYLRILEQFYGIRQTFDFPVIQMIQDPETGLDRFFRMKFNLRFVEIHPVGELKKLTEEERATVLERLTEPEVLREILPPQGFEIRGFTVLQAVDVTESEVMSALERDLTDQESFFSGPGFTRLQNRLRTLFRRPDLVAGLAALHEDQVLVLNTGCQMARNCVFSDSHHMPVTDFQGSVFHRAVEGQGIVRIPDLAQEGFRTPVEGRMLEQGVRSMLIAPLLYQGKPIGTLDLSSPKPGDLGPVEALLAEQILPLFSVALKRGMEEIEHRVQTVIKEKCTAVHPVVEWRFRKAAFRYLDEERAGSAGELEPIVFRDIYPLYGAADIRGSSEERSRAIQADLSEQLSLALAVVDRAVGNRPQPVLQELAYRITKAVERIERGLGSGDEVSLVASLRKDVEPLFPHLQEFGPGVATAIQAYQSALDPHLGTVYRRRRDFEESVSSLTSRFSAYLDREEAEAQLMYPHYFEKHRTDGVDYLIYLGPSLLESGEFTELHLENFRLWQIMVACGIAWITERMKPSLKLPLETAHLILLNHTPMSIRFRFDEKRFDVDGAYDVRHEILKARIDKAVIKGGRGRLTQPGRIAMVYSNLEEAREARRHVDFLHAQGYLNEGLESLDLEDLPGVQGLRALRVGVNLDSERLSERMERMAG